MTETPAPDLRALRELAEAATPGVWDHTSDGSIGDNANWIAYTAGQTDWDIANAAFIAAANPTAVLALLDRLAAAEAAVERVRALADEWDRRALPIPAEFENAITDLHDALEGAS